jgi:hypothetical protein
MICTSGIKLFHVFTTSSADSDGFEFFDNGTIIVFGFVHCSFLPFQFHYSLVVIGKNHRPFSRRVMRLRSSGFEESKPIR